MSEDNSTTRYVDLSTLGFPGYRVDDDGHVWSCLELFFETGVKGFKSRITNHWRKMKPRTANRNRYFGITLRSGGKTKAWFVHVLIATAFIGPRPSGCQCCHINGNGKDNRAINLKWATPRENCADRAAHGRQYHPKGRLHHNVTLTELDVLNIRKWASAGTKQMDLAELFGVSRALICLIVNRKNWTHI